MVMNYFTLPQCFIKGLCINVCNHVFPMFVLAIRQSNPTYQPVLNAHHLW